MYKTILFTILMITSITGFAQNFSYTPSTTNYSSSQPSSNMLPQRQPIPSAQGFANSTERAFQAQQAKIAALAAEKRRISEMNAAKQSLAPAGNAQKPQQLPTQQFPRPIQQQTPTIQPAAAAPVQPKTAPAPYTGFQSPNTNPTTGGGTAAPANNNSNSSGWGSSIKY